MKLHFKKPRTDCKKKFGDFFAIAKALHNNIKGTNILIYDNVNFKILEVELLGDNVLFRLENILGVESIEIKNIEKFYKCGKTLYIEIKGRCNNALFLFYIILLPLSP